MLWQISPSWKKMLTLTSSSISVNKFISSACVAFCRVFKSGSNINFIIKKNKQNYKDKPYLSIRVRLYSNTTQLSSKTSCCCRSYRLWLYVKYLLYMKKRVMIIFLSQLLEGSNSLWATASESERRPLLSW